MVIESPLIPAAVAPERLAPDRLTEFNFALVKFALERFAFVKLTLVKSAFLRLAPERLTLERSIGEVLVPVNVRPASEAPGPKRYPRINDQLLGKVAPDPRSPPVMRFAGDVEEKIALVIVA